MPVGLTASSVATASIVLDIGGLNLDTRGVALDEDESRRSVNDRTDDIDVERSVKDRAEAFDLFLECRVRSGGRDTRSGASSNVS